jgi:hypothetical protein
MDVMRVCGAIPIAELCPPLVGDRAIDATRDEEFSRVIASNARILGLCIVAAIAGEISSSAVVFARLAMMLRRSLDTREPLADDLWRLWDYGTNGVIGG